MRSLLPPHLLEPRAIGRSPPGKAPTIDPSEIERRRHFYIQQRDILRDKEEKEGKIRRRTPG
jgi:hypothetical protein